MDSDGPLVLIIDDDDDTRYVYSRMLAHRGYRVEQASDAAAGVALAAERVPTVIIMDYVLPGMNGWEATRRLKADVATAGIPVINVTAYHYAGIDADALAAGCDAFIAKPCDPQDVVAMVATLVARRAQQGV